LSTEREKLKINKANAVLANGNLSIHSNPRLTEHINYVNSLIQVKIEYRNMIEEQYKDGVNKIKMNYKLKVKRLVRNQSIDIF